MPKNDMQTQTKYEVNKNNGYERAKLHPIAFTGPAPDFFEGALLGNGGLGIVVTTRPDAVMLHFGHNNVWDIRLAEEHRDELMTFQEVYDRFAALPADLQRLTDHPWYKQYCKLAGQNYSKAYPKPMPCGSLLLRYDRRKAEIIGHTIDIANGLCTVDFLLDGKPVVFELFVEAERDRIWMNVYDADTGALAALFNEVKLIPDPETPSEFPQAAVITDKNTNTQSFTQILPHVEHPSAPYVTQVKDKAFRLAVTVSGLSEIEEQPFRTPVSEAILSPSGVHEHGFLACAELWEGLYNEIDDEALPPDLSSHIQAKEESTAMWQDYWSRSSVALEDEFLERIWYHNLYFFNCAVKEGVTCPGLFANWSYRTIGADWHGDYHMNYNTQQPFWLAFSSNHLDKHLPYVDMVDHVLPVSRAWARDYYGLSGAYFPHSAYPVEMSMMPYPVPHWGWEICETPWTVQSLWWHYLYSMDETFLRDRAFEPMKEAVLFMVDYMKRPEAQGERWGDDNYHIFPTVVPELYEIAPGFGKNKDGLIDLTLTRFLFNAFTQACGILERVETEQKLLENVKEILCHFPSYPTAKSGKGPVFVSVEGEDPDVVYNVPIPITTVFPGEDHGLHSPEEAYQTAVNSYLNHRNEGGNELVFYHLAGARLGVLDLERFKRQIQYCLLPNGTCTDRVLMSGGRYADTDNFDFMSRMGIWFENFALPAVINECLLQSYNGNLRFFPNWPNGQRAEFHTLRAVGGFLVSAAFVDGETDWIEIESEAGSSLSFYIPWTEGAICTLSSGEQYMLSGPIGKVTTVTGDIITMVKAKV
ncbi:MULTISPECIES: glycosyl hydrolase family 95 catalytic domain-containing protein [unclassified Paenibacillus]|uniref:glycosyl hydrolase family 95 catalytic domain-containing protein n=1 Tax=unclassified Paenibacillus TaxID=185978 RepID=UPI000406BB47|nr:MULTISPECIES: glycoside hydrolase N-terminal domain-containing protein [unclassified Paenibacillus]